MTTSSNILSLPFRNSTHLSFKNVVKQYISEKYDQHPDMFRDDLESIDALRRDAVNVREAHPSGIPKLQAYAAQLVWMGTKFPIDIGCDFSWYPALGYNTDRPVIRNNLKFELINVLFNLAALYVQLAVASNRGTAEGLKTAANHFMNASGVLFHIKTSIIPELRTDPPDDMDNHSLDCLIQLFLAQAQECFWHKAVNSGIKDATIAKLAAQVSDFYGCAGDEAVNSQAISSPWIHHMNAKHHHFAAAAQYRAARDCLDKGKYGEEIARLKDTVACVKDGLLEARGGYINQMVLNDLQGLEGKAKEDLKRAEKDNNLIYLQVVPEKTELNSIGRAPLSKMQCPPEVSDPIEHLGDNTQLGPALFSKLVPFAVHLAVSLYEENKNSYVEDKVVRVLETLEEQLRENLTDLNLPASLQALEKPLGLPPAVIEYADIVQQERALEAIPMIFSQIDEMRKQCCDAFVALQEMLEAEEAEDEALRRKYGTQRWARPSSREDISGARYWDNCANLENYLSITSSSDATVRQNFDDYHKILALLSGSRQALLDFVPSSRRTEIPHTFVPVIAKLRAGYNEILRLQSRRRKKIESIQARARQDDIRADILKEASRLERQRPTSTITAADFAGFFDQRIRAHYGNDAEAMAMEQHHQVVLLEEVGALNRDFENEKRRLGGKNGLGGQERQAALQQLEEAYNAYCRIKKDLESGKKFYNELAKQVDQLSTKAIPWVDARRKEARDLEAELNMPHLTNLSISNPASPNQGPNQYFPSPQPQQVQEQHPPTPQQQLRVQNNNSHRAPTANMMSQPPEPHLQSWASQIVVPQQPKPMPVGVGTRWTPDMGIKFGPPAAASATPSAFAAAGGGGGGSGLQQPQASSSVSPSILANSFSPQQQQHQRQQQQPGTGTTWDQSKPLRFG